MQIDMDLGYYHSLMLVFRGDANQAGLNAMAAQVRLTV